MTHRTLNRTIYCHNCAGWFDPLGIMSHRAAHFRRGEEEATLTLTDRSVVSYAPGVGTEVTKVGAPMPKRRYIPSSKPFGTSER